MAERVFLDGRLTLSGLPSVMAILNATPDSFSDGGRFASAEDAIRAGLMAADAGAAILDVGGESTRPRGTAYGAGATAVDEAEEARRVLPVIAGIRAADSAIPISIDTRKVEVARQALEAGADIVNVVTGLDPEPALLGLVAERRALLILNHCRGTPADTFQVSRFEDVVTEVARDLHEALSRAEAAGIDRSRVLLDPGLGFGKTPDQNFAILSRLEELTSRGQAWVFGASRKAFLNLQGRPPNERLPESLAAVAVIAEHARASGTPSLVRVHDVSETVRFLAVLRLGTARLQTPGR